MQNSSQNNYFLKLFLILFLITLVKIGILYINKTPLWVDEAQYWFWSKFPDTGYYSKPPMIAWIIGFFTKYLGDEIFWIRLPAALLHMATAIYIYLIGNKLYDEKVGFYSAISYITLPVISFSSFFISSDVPLMLCWAGAFYHFITAIELKDENRFFSWIIFALWLGLGLMSKYTTILLAGGIGLFVLNNRFGLLFTANFWFSFILAGLVFLPNILWNSKNEFASFHHTQENLTNSETSVSLIEKLSNLHFMGLLEFIGGQILILGPILFLFTLFAIFKKVKSETLLIAEERTTKAMLLYISLPVIIAGIILSIISESQVHWTGPAYISLIILTCWYLLKKDGEFWIKLSIYLGIIFSLVLSFGIVTSDKDFVRQITKNSPFDRLYTWYNLAEPVRKQANFYNDALIASDERKIIAPLTYALRSGSKPKIVYKWTGNEKIRDHFDLKYKLSKDYQGNVIFITRSVDQVHLRKFFYKVTTLDVKDKFKIYLLNGQKNITSDNPL